MTTILAADLFCGSGGTSSGLMQAAADLGLDVNLVAVNHWQTAIETHAANHPSVTHFCEDLETVNPRHAVPGGHLHLLVASPECFPAGTLILTEVGLIPIEQVKVGTNVATHRGLWEPVTEVVQSVQDTVVVSGHGHYGLTTTNNHPFYSRKRLRVWNNSLRRWQFDFTDAEWTDASDMTGRHWATPTALATLPLPHPPFAANYCFWWMIGRWLGDGSVQLRPGKGGEVTICCGFHEADELQPRLASALPGINIRRRDARTATLFEINHTEFARWLTKHFGKLAHGKRLPAWALAMSRAMRLSLLDGYMSADGHFDGRKHEATTVSRSLAISIRLLAESLGHRTALHACPQHSKEIEGRAIAGRDVYRVMWVDNPKREYSREIDALAWSRVRSVTPGPEQVTVYNLSVKNDESYIADGIVVHNCTHHSNARGGRPMSDQSRASAWHVLRWADALYIDHILIENVKEFRDWGPLGEDGRPIAAMKGRLYRQFLAGLRALGYTVSERILNAADFGDATTRQRLFIQARRGTKRPVWPAPTHIKPVVETALPGLMDGLATWRPARDIIDWSLPGKSIYGRKKPLAPATMARIFAGLRKYSGLPFIVPNLSEREGQAPRTHNIDDPLPTVTTFGGGNLVEPFLIGAGGPVGAGEPQSVGDPLGTVLTENHRALVQPFLVVLRNHCDAQAVTEPIPTLTTGGNMGVVESFIVPTTHGGGPGRAHDIGLPLPTVTTAHRGEMALAEPFLMVIEHSTEGHDRRVHPLERPLTTVTGSGGFGLCQPYLTEFHGGTTSAERTRSVSEPICTLDTSNRVGLAEPFLISYYGQGGAASVNEPLDTVTGRDRFALVDPQLVTDGLVDKDDVVGWLDIRFRMLQPHELAAAMSFPKTYQFTGNREAQVKQIGNSVAVRTAKALCLEILKEYPK